MINWLNEVAQKNQPLTYLADEYNQLYSDYTRVYALHKLSSTFTMMEVLVATGLEFISDVTQHNFLAAFKGLLTVRKQQVELLRAEKDIQGKELAYIVVTNEKFA